MDTTGPDNYVTTRWYDLFRTRGGGRRRVDLTAAEWLQFYNELRSAATGVGRLPPVTGDVPGLRGSWLGFDLYAPDAA